MIHLAGDSVCISKAEDQSPMWHLIKMMREKESPAGPITTHRETVPINAANGLQCVLFYTIHPHKHTAYSTREENKNKKLTSNFTAMIYWLKENHNLTYASTCILYMKANAFKPCIVYYI